MKRWISLGLPCLALGISVLVGCKSSGSSALQQKATGKPGELVLVMDKQYFEAPMGLKLYDLLEDDAPSLPQAEPSLRISRVPTQSFTGFMQLVRNVLIVDVDKDRYTTTSMKYSYDDWAKGQVVMRMTSPSPDSIMSYLDSKGEGIMNVFVRHELFLFGELLAKQYSTRAKHFTDSLFGRSVNVPEDIRNQKVAKDFLWMSNSSMRSRHDILVYSSPYTEQNYGLLYRRVQLPGEESPRAEVRGLWKMTGGAMMGGPFVSHAILDKAAQRVLVFEGFVYRPNEDKLHLIRMMEAALYSLRPSSVKSFDPELILKAAYTKGF